MIERCSKKQMVFAIAVLAGLSFLIIILESSQLRSNNEEFNDIHDTHPVLKEKLKDKDKCFTKENYEVIEQCEVCTEEEVTNHDPIVCAVEKSEIKAEFFKEIYLILNTFRLQREGEVLIRC